MLKLLVQPQLLRQAPTHRLRALRLILLPPLPLFQIENLRRTPSVPLDKSPPMRYLLRQARDLALVDVEERFQLFDAGDLSSVEVSGRVESFFGRVALLRMSRRVSASRRKGGKREDARGGV